MKILLVLLACTLLASSAIAQEIYDAPSAIKMRNEDHPQDFKTWKAYKGHNAKYTSIRTFNEPLLRSNKQVFKDKGFWASEILMYSATVTDMRLEKSTVPRGPDYYIDPLVPAAFASAFHYLTYRAIWAPIGTGVVGYVTAIRIKGMAKNQYQ